MSRGFHRIPRQFINLGIELRTLPVELGLGVRETLFDLGARLIELRPGLVDELLAAGLLTLGLGLVLDAVRHRAHGLVVSVGERVEAGGAAHAQDDRGVHVSDVGRATRGVIGRASSHAAG